MPELKAISSCPLTVDTVAETSPHLATPSFQGIVESEEVPPEPSLF